MNFSANRMQNKTIFNYAEVKPKVECNSSMRKISVVTGTRAEYGLLSRLMRMIMDSQETQLQVIATNMHLSPKYGNTYKEIEKDGFTIDCKVPIIDKNGRNDSLSTVLEMSCGLKGYAEAYQKLNPDMLLILGDRYEMLAAATAALIMRIPIAHISGGAISGASLTTTGAATVGGNLKVSGNVTSALTPNTNNSYDLGTSSYRWKTLYSKTIDVNAATSKGINVTNAGTTSATENYAIYGTANCTETNCKNYGVYGYAEQVGTAKTYGVYAKVQKSTGSVGNYWGMYSEGKAGGSTEWYESSDARLKKDVHTLTGALDKVLKLRGVSFYWKNREEMAALKGVPADSVDYGYDNVKHIGVIAQELEAEYPELVNTDGDGFKSVGYANLTPILIEAVKEQQAIIDAQNKKIEELEAKAKEVDELKAQMKEILEKLK